MYRATAQRWASDCVGGMQPGEAEWRDLESQAGDHIRAFSIWTEVLSNTAADGKPV